MSLGLRYETQNNIHDWRDFAPRIGVAWAPGAASGKSRPKNVIRAGFGMFYDRFGLANSLAARRYNGAIQQQYIIANPDFFPNVPAVSSLTGSVPPSTIQQISSTLRAPYLMQSALGFERQLPLNTTVAIPPRTRMACIYCAPRTSMPLCPEPICRRFPAAACFRSEHLDRYF
jgi:hypothetical protein